MDEMLMMPTAEEAAQLQLTLSQCIMEIDELREMMSRDDIEIARSQARSRVLMAEINSMQTQSRLKTAQEMQDQRDRENAAHEHEKLLLRLEVTSLRAERRTLIGRSDPKLLLEDTDETLPPGQ